MHTDEHRLAAGSGLPGVFFPSLCPTFPCQLALFLLTCLLTLTHAAGAPGWTRLPSLPDPEGFASMFAGVSGGALLAAGGANFADKKPWDGGK